MLRLGLKQVDLDAEAGVEMGLKRVHLGAKAGLQRMCLCAEMGSFGC